jgi:hypothetical protein
VKSRLKLGTALVTSGALTLALVGCGARTPKSNDPSGNAAAGEGEGGQKVETKTIKNPDGSTSIITTTTKWVEAPDPPDRPADPFPSDPLVKYNVDQLNAYRVKAGLAPLKFDAKVSAFAMDGSKQLSSDHKPHAHFIALAKGHPDLGTRSAENQGDWNGVPELDTSSALANGKKQIDIMLKMMFDEGPGGGHHDNMLNPKMKRVGIGLYYTGGKLYLTNDFSN